MSSTSTPTTPADLLEAVNELLQAIRVSGVMSLTASDTNQDAADAKKALDNASREVQLRGWEFNTEYDYVVDPAPDGTVTLPVNCLKFRRARTESGVRLVGRGQPIRLYDNTKHTYTIGTSVTVEMVIALPFEDLGASFRKYVTALAARRFCIPKLPSGATFAYTDEFLQAAEAEALQADTQAEDGDLKQTSPHFAAMGRR